MPTGSIARATRVSLRTRLRPVVPIVPVTLVLATLTLTGVGIQPILSGRSAIPLPSAPGTSLAHGAWHVLRLELGSSGTPLILLNGTRHTLSSLPEAIQTMVAREPDAQLRIQANSLLPFSEVQQLTLLAQEQGVARVVLEVKQATPSRSGSSAPSAGTGPAPWPVPQGGAHTPVSNPENPPKE